ncbi:MAG: ABC transporter ATP-binding protein [Leptolyngbyaceae cyanobacterium]
MSLIQATDITKTYSMGDIQVHALAGISFTLNRGDYCAIMGASGSGKSTLMNIIGCLDRPTTGHYQLDAMGVDQLSDDELAHIRNRKIGFVFQQFHLLPQLTATDNVMLPMVYAEVSYEERRQRAEAALVRVGLGDRLQNKPRQLSGGQQQRVAIARAIVNQPVLLLADEPTGALDTQTTEEILHIFGALNASGMTVIMVTHEIEVARNTRRIIWFRDGQILHQNLNPQQLSDVVAAA